MDERSDQTAGAVPAAGTPRTAVARARLLALDELPLAEHVELYDEVHRLLQDALAGLDDI
ncbi:MAG: hypothetical protein NVSMB13_18360 [Mycobacteriales bacterium]